MVVVVLSAEVSVAADPSDPEELPQATMAPEEIATAKQAVTSAVWSRVVRVTARV